MDLLFTPKKESILSVFTNITRIYRGREHYIFDAIGSLDINFSQPASPRDYSIALEEFKSHFNYANINGLSKFFKIIKYLIEIPYDEHDGYLLRDLIASIRLTTDDAATTIIMNERRIYTAEWSVRAPSLGQDENQIIQLELFDCDQNTIVPIYVVEYVKSAVLLYSQQLSKCACALMTIATEATLRDILRTRGYQYTSGSSSDDQYCFTDAVVDVTDKKDKFTISSTAPLIKSVSDYCVENSVSTIKNIKIKRRIYNRNGKFELVIRNCGDIYEYFSSSQIETLAKRSISGFGTALHIARTLEHIIEPALLPLDMDDILTGIRNNLVHLSGAGLDAAQIQEQTLNDFLNNRYKVFDLIQNIPYLISKKYAELYT